MTAQNKAEASGFRVDQDLNWLRRLFDLPGQDQSYVLKGVLVLDRTSGVAPVQALFIRTPEDLSSIERRVLIQPVDLWSGENSRFEAFLDGAPFHPGRQYVETSGLGYDLVFPRNFVIPRGKEVVLRWTSLTDLGQPAWFYYIRGAIAVEVVS